MDVLETKVDGVTVVAIAGRLDATTAPDLETRLLGLIGGGERRLVVDCARLDYVSSAGLRVLLVAAKRLKEANGRIVLAGLHDPIKEVFDIAGFSTIFSMFPTRAAAVAAV